MPIALAPSGIEESALVAPLGLRARWAALGSAATLAVCATVTPETLASGPVMCPMRAVLGIPCPGCGLTRSCSACLHGDVAQSIAFHPFGPLVCAAAVAAVLLFSIGLATRRRPLLATMVAVRRRPPLRFAAALALFAWLGWAACRAAAAVAG